jgi:hypothetical protein
VCICISLVDVPGLCFPAVEHESAVWAELVEPAGLSHFGTRTLRVDSLSTLNPWVVLSIMLHRLIDLDKLINTVTRETLTASVSHWQLQHC